MAGRRGNREGSYRRHGRRWQASVRIAGHRYWVSGESKAECREKVLALLERHRQGQLAPPSRLTLGEWAESWLAGKAASWRPTTLRRARQALQPLLERLGRLRLSRLEPLALALALDALRGRGVGSRTVELAYAHLHTCLEEAVKLGLLGANPLARVSRPRHETLDESDWELDGLRRFLQAALLDGRPLALLLAFLLLTGLRPSEALGLRWEDVGWEDETLRVRRAVVWAGSAWQVGAPKSRAGLRTLALPRLALDVLARLPRGEGFVFWQSRPPDAKALSRVMASLCQRAGLPRRPAHYLRHCHASLLVHLGADIKTAQRRLGHATAAMTLDVYSHSLGAGERQLAAQLDRALQGDGGPAGA